MESPSPDNAPHRPAMVLKKHIANNSPIQLKKKATEKSFKIRLIICYTTNKKHHYLLNKFHDKSYAVI